LEQLDSENNRAQIIATRGGTDLQDRLALYESHVSRLEALIPQREEVSALLNDITAESRRAGVEVASLTPEPDEVGAFYTKHSYQIDVIGDFHDIGRFLTNIASLPRIITPVNLDISAFRGDATVLSPEFETPLTASLQIQTYILPEASAETSAPGGESQEGR
jgi:type IV pilus assembly protein PilO